MTALPRAKLGPSDTSDKAGPTIPTSLFVEVRFLLLICNLTTSSQRVRTNINHPHSTVVNSTELIRPPRAKTSKQFTSSALQITSCKSTSNFLPATTRLKMFMLAYQQIRDQRSTLSARVAGAVITDIAASDCSSLKLSRSVYRGKWQIQACSNAARCS